MAELKPCPFCGSTDLYETYSQEYLGTKNPEIFCNSCKMIFAVEDDSPYMNCEEDYVYRKNKTLEAWNRRTTIEPELIRCEDTVRRADVEIEIANILRHVFVEYQDIAKKAAAKLPSAQPEQRWIPCGKCIHADGKHRWCKVLDRTINEDYFCYWAEPWKEGEADGQR